MSRRKVGPAALVVEAREGADGAKNGGDGDLDQAGLFDETFHDETDILATQGIEASGAGVAVDDVEVVYLEVTADKVGAVPVDVRFFDGVEVGMAAKLAFAAMALEAWDGGAAVFESGARGATTGTGGLLFGGGLLLGAMFCLSFDLI
ncbi:MAG: hypothetical protein ACYDDI_07555 [Candidatus Acidiferrales bacterium]